MICKSMGFKRSIDWITWGINPGLYTETLLGLHDSTILTDVQCNDSYSGVDVEECSFKNYKQARCFGMDKFAGRRLLLVLICHPKPGITCISSYATVAITHIFLNAATMQTTVTPYRFDN